MAEMVDIIYTIGYAGFGIDAFLAALHQHRVKVLVDVRSSPFSGFHQDYNKPQLEQTLRSQGIYYRNYAREFGARQTERSYYPKGYLDFELWAESPEFREGVRKIEDSMEQGYTFALMCAEIEPIDCHRTILVARAFSDHGYDVQHIRPRKPLLPHKDLEAQLLDLYFPDRDQIVLGQPVQDEKELLKEAYRLRNEKIGYRLEDV
ncbi:MAG: DUF488 domain-containing protein [Oscillibacter sp.]|nr:DUF488 domain-containing protein [Oscillibacter sp.]